VRSRQPALAYLTNLWEREPENGFVNLELARIAAQRGETDQAIRFYHNAVYAVWPTDQEGTRRDARLELIELLLRIKDQGQPQGELIALAESVGPDPVLQERIGELFLRAEDYVHALAAFDIVLKSDRHNVPALAGAGDAAFELGQYPLAQRYLQAAVTPECKEGGSGRRSGTPFNDFAGRPAARGRRETRLNVCCLPLPPSLARGRPCRIAEADTGFIAIRP
jgi:tetratricopeptide (TPR) repeat protein